MAPSRAGAKGEGKIDGIVRGLWKLPVGFVVDHLVLIDRYGLTLTEARILTVLAGGTAVPVGELRDRCCRKDAADNAVKVHIANLNRRIAPHTIRNVRPKRYCLEGASLLAVLNVMEGRSEIQDGRGRPSSGFPG